MQPISASHDWLVFRQSPLRQLAKIRDWLGVTETEHDPQGRVIKVTDPKGRETAYEWGNLGERKSITYSDGRKVHYGYDEHLRLQTFTTPEGTEITYRYDQSGRLMEKNFGEEIRTLFLYDGQGQLKELAHEDREGVLDRYCYGYDEMGNKISIKKERRGLPEESGIYQYGYDALNQLTTVTKDDTLATRYTYDPFGNRIKKEDLTTGLTTTSTYNSLNQLIMTCEKGETGRRQKEYAYDRRGNLITETEEGGLFRGYEYGAMNRLDRTWDKAGNTIHYIDNGLGQRVGRNETEYLLDLTLPYHNLLQICEGEQKQSFYWDGNVTAFSDSREEGSVHRLLSDELGSLIRAEREAGSYESYGYDEFGNDLYGNQGGYQPFGYTGEYYSKETKMIYLRNRYYSPTTGRFLAEDPIKSGLNWYTYCNNNPILYVDPSGLRYRGTEALGFGMGDDSDQCPYSMKPESHDIANVQLKLQELGYLGDISAYGYYGKATQAAILQFNIDNGLGNSKKVDDKTWATLGLNFQEVYPFSLTERERMIIATAAGEAYQAGSPAYSAVAQVIMNRFDANPNTKTQDILKHSQFNAIGEPVYNNVMDYFSNRTVINPEYEDIISTVMGTINGDWADSTQGATFFYSPDPSRPTPNWVNDMSKEIYVPGVSSDLFRFFVK